MNNKCPSINKNNQVFLIETIYNAQFDIESVLEPNLDIKYIINNNENLPSFFITNYLLIKCPICLTFKRNTIIQKCGHCLCKDCLNNYLISNIIFKCWLCRQSYEKYYLSL